MNAMGVVGGVTILAVAAAVLSMAPVVSIRVSSQVVQAGNTVRVTCTVPRDPRNRGLVLAIDGYTSSYVQLDGDAAPITHDRYFTHVPCDVDTASCTLNNRDRATLPLLVGGCDQ